MLNITKSDTSIGTVGTLIIDVYSIGMSGTFATFGKLLALQGRDLVSTEIYGNNFTNVEIDMTLSSSVTMDGAVVFTNNDGSIKTCTSELHRTAGKLHVGGRMGVRASPLLHLQGRGHIRIPSVSALSFTSVSFSLHLYYPFSPFLLKATQNDPIKGLILNKTSREHKLVTHMYHFHCAISLGYWFNANPGPAEPRYALPLQTV